MGLDGSTFSEYLPERTCHFESLEHVPRTSARAQTCARGPGRLPACHGAEGARKDPQAEENRNCRRAKRTHIYIAHVHVIQAKRGSRGPRQCRKKAGASEEERYINLKQGREGIRSERRGDCRRFMLEGVASSCVLSTS